MKIVFIGTPDYVVPILDGLYKTFKTKSEKFPICAVLTQKPKPKGRKQILEYSAVDKWAHKKDVPIFFDPERLIDKEINADIGILAAYGNIIPDNLLNYFKHGILNIHPSLLPKYRGASPVRAAIAKGDRKTGVTIIKLDNKLDHGPIISQFEEEVKKSDDTQTLRSRLFNKSIEVLVSLLPAYTKGKIKLRQQDHKKATYTFEIKNKDAYIPPTYLDKALEGNVLKEKWNIPFIKDCKLTPTVTNINNFIRAMEPWPKVWTTVSNNKRTKRLKILNAHVKEKKLIIDEVQLEGKKPVTWKQFKEGYPEVKFF